MLRAMWWKELRETAWIAAVALLAYVYVASEAASLSLWPGQVRYDRELPFVGDSFLTGFGIVSGLLVIALGLRQSLGESHRDTYLFLLHRPVARWKIVAMKLASGASLYLVLAALPVLSLAAWAATPGSHPAPFFWSMTDPAWRLWLSMIVLYLAAFLSGMRPARWFGTRLLPLAAASVAVAVLQFIPWWWIFGLALLAVAAALAVRLILFVSETRDYA